MDLVIKPIRKDIKIVIKLMSQLGAIIINRSILIGIIEIMKYTTDND
jgi:hypothetical protein